MKFNNAVDYIRFIGLLIAISGTILLSVNYSMSNFNEKKIEEIVSNSVRKEIKPIGSYIETQMVKNIIKQANKVLDDPTDIKLADVEQGIRDWKYIEDKTVFIQDKYDIMYKWYEDTVLNNKK